VSFASWTSVRSATDFNGIARWAGVHAHPLRGRVGAQPAATHPLVNREIPYSLRGDLGTPWVLGGFGGDVLLKRSGRALGGVREDQHEEDRHAEDRRQANTSSRVRVGYSSRTSSIESPAPRNSRTVCAVIRVPRRVGRPLHTAGWMRMRSSMDSDGIKQGSPHPASRPRWH